MYDVIGDIHGQGEKLRALLAKLGYAERAGHWRAPQGRMAVFVGDLIDRGPEQLAVLEIVRRMVDDGQACRTRRHLWGVVRRGPRRVLRRRGPQAGAQAADLRRRVGVARGFMDRGQGGAQARRGPAGGVAPLGGSAARRGDRPCGQ
ncbi:MAG: metallophosphoesterase [Betaproteobacteria bacterium]|nr:metallophosphoesterase [Betaproteobacteria bacterium]